MDKGELYYSLVNTKQDLVGLLKQIPPGDYEATLEYFHERMEQDYSFYPQGLGPEQEKGKPPVPVDVRKRLGVVTSYLFTSNSLGDHEWCEERFHSCIKHWEKEQRRQARRVWEGSNPDLNRHNLN